MTPNGLSVTLYSSSGNWNPIKPHALGWETLTLLWSACGLWFLLGVSAGDDLPYPTRRGGARCFLTFLNGYMATSSFRAASSQGISRCQVISSNTN